VECPSRAILAGMIDGAGSDVVLMELEEHVGACARCQSALEELSGSCGGALLSDGTNRETDPDGAALRELQARLEHWSSSGLGRGAALGRVPASLHFLRAARRPGYIGALGPYDVIEEIGRGGMGIVLKAHDPSLRRLVAIKVLAPELATSPVARKRFTREAHAAAAISDHDHVVTIFAIEDRPGELPFLVMQLIVGRSLHQRLQAEGPLDPREALRIGLQTARALAFAHGQGLIHRDVKPANILVLAGGRPKLTDFGVAHLESSVITRQVDGLRLGTGGR
jgi:serine/threonine protein kinase